MPDEYNHNLPAAAYRAALLAEVQTPNITREHKAAIVAELERLGPRTADEDRAAVEAATLGPVTVGRAPSVDVVQIPDVATIVDPGPQPRHAATVTSPENNSTALGPADDAREDSGR